ncbi:putative DNA excision repair protein ERCC-6 [Apostichopus japonicus]|uniref:Putative DNA excision repair protein ERCC-6 n=1 Tax=Stichopus japonicus TaxID=307972 RepID=A0A2G8KBR7_STIJA|nr:putative DNA excision repair protein ERCC-6 [Apostichopus japonicus]
MGNDVKKGLEESSEDEIILPVNDKKRKKKSKAEQIEDGEITCLDDLKSSYGVKVKRSMADRVAKCLDDSSQDLYFKRLRYQMTGVRWMWELHQQRAGGIMGDEMGLGKTIQMIAFLAGLKHSHLRDPEFRYEGLGPVLIVCPATVMYQWVKEFHRWYPEIRVAILHTSGSHIGSKATLVRDIVNTHSVLVTSYTTCRIQQELLHKFDWHYVILDEGHKIRNPDAEATIACKQFRTPHRLILTGSPLQNNLQELWSLFDFVFPGKLGTLPIFLEQFSVPITQGGYANATSVQVQTAYKCACVLRDTINPYLLRRMKVDVQQNIQLPSKNEQVLFCRLTDEQRELYRDYLNSRECHQIMKGEYQIFSGLITMRKICNHPHLVTGGPRILKGDDEEDLPEEERYGHWSKAGKMVVITSLLKIWKEQGHRVLLFSQGKQMLDIIESFVKTRYKYLRLDGSTGIASRQSLINRFNQNSSIFVFILTTRVGGLGVNLTGANRVIIYDPDWNPSTDSQARERAWRIGQKRDVTIYRLLTAGTIEEKIYTGSTPETILQVQRSVRAFSLNDGTEETETSAIFAGTGSNIKLNKETTPSPSNRPTKKLQRSRTVPSGISRNGTRDGVDLETSKERKGHTPDEKKKVFDFANISECSEEEKSPEDEMGERQRIEVKRREEEEIAEREARKKKKKRKKKKDAKLDGVRIANLAKHRVFRSTKDEEQEDQDEEKEAHEKQDKFVLEKLFRKTGVHSALKHDNIMEASNPDYVLIENEATRVAKEAARALKESRQTCPNARSGVPTWTGTIGQGGGSGSSRPKFGQKLNSNLAGPVSAQNGNSPEIKEEEKQTLLGGKKLFGGDEAINNTSSLQQGSSLPSSSLLLAKMRARNQVQMKEPEEEGSTSNMVPLVSKKYEQLMNQVKIFITEQARIPGQASTDEILKNFQRKLPPKTRQFLGRCFVRSVNSRGAEMDRAHGDLKWNTFRKPFNFIIDLSWIQ